MASLFYNPIHTGTKKSAYVPSIPRPLHFLPAYLENIKIAGQSGLHKVWAWPQANVAMTQRKSGRLPLVPESAALAAESARQSASPACHYGLSAWASPPSAAPQRD